MNLYNGNENENKGGAPLLGKTSSPFRRSSTFGKTPMISRAAGGIIERLKNLSRKDMAFVGVGLSVLVMAPVAEYMMSKPSADNMLASGFGSRNASSGSGLYEPGINALSQGGPDGNGEVITPLSSRDPSSLILGAQPAQPMVASAPPPDTSMRDAVRDSGRAAFSEAVKSAGAPTPIPRMSAVMRSSMFGGGGEGTRTAGSLSGKAIIEDAKSASAKAAKRSMVGPVAPAGYKGVSNNVPNSASNSTLDKLRAQAGKSASNFGDASASSGLDKAAAEAANVGAGGGLGAGESGIGSKNPSNSTRKNSHSSQGECNTLACQAEKKRQEKALEWEFFKKYEIPKQLINAVLSGFTSSLTKFVTSKSDKLFGQSGGGATEYICVQWINKDLGCVKGNLLPGIRSSNEKTIDGWNAKGSCPCGPQTSEEFTANNGGSTDTKTGTKTGTGTGTGTVERSTAAYAAFAKEFFKDYDSFMMTLLVDAEDGSNTKDPKKLLVKTEAVAGAFEKLKVDGLANAVANYSNAAVSDPVAQLELKVNEASSQVSAKRVSYNNFMTKFAKVEAAAEAGTLKAVADVGDGTGNKAEVDLSASVKPYLATARKSLKSYEDMFLVKAEKDLEVNNSAIRAYRSQAGYVVDNAGAISKDYTGTVRPLTDKAYQDMTALKAAVEKEKRNLTPAETANVIETFKALTGKQTKLTAAAGPVTGANSGSLDVSKLNLKGIDSAVDGGVKDVVGEDERVHEGGMMMDGRDAPGAVGTTPLDKAILWRGLALKDKKYDDGKAINDEVAAWNQASPLKKTEVFVSPNNLPDGALLGGAIRSAKELPDDAAANIIDPTAIVGKLAPVETKMDEVKKSLKAWNIDMDNLAGGPATLTETDTKTKTQTETKTQTITDTGTGTGNGGGSGNSNGTVTGTGNGAGSGTGTASQTLNDDKKAKNIYNRTVAKYPAWPYAKTGANYTKYDRAHQDAEEARHKINSLYAAYGKETDPAKKKKILQQMTDLYTSYNRDIKRMNAAIAEEKKAQAANAGAGSGTGAASDMSKEALRKAAFDSLPQQLGVIALNTTKRVETDTYCEDGKKLKSGFKCENNVVKRCSKDGYLGCNAWTNVKTLLPKYTLMYTRANSDAIDQVGPTRPDNVNVNGINISPDGKSARRMFERVYGMNSYNITVRVQCVYTAQTKGWKVSSATIQKGEGASSNTWGVSIKGSFKPFGVGVDVTGSYNHSWSVLNNGAVEHMDRTNGFYGIGQPCDP